MDWWTEVSNTLRVFLNEHGLLAAFVFLLVEEAGVPVPVPGDFLMVVLGVQASQGLLRFWQVVVVLEAATVVGATVLYFLSSWAGRTLVYRYGRVLHLTPERLNRAETWLHRYGGRAVFLGRLVPGLRIATAVGCGIFGVPFRVFAPSMAFGALSYILIYTSLGYLIGPPVLGYLEHVHLPLGLLGSLVPLVILLIFTVRARQDYQQRKRIGLERTQHVHLLRAGAVAGGMATVTSTLLISVLLNVVGSLAFQVPGTIVEVVALRLATALAYENNLAFLLAVVPLYLAVGVLWGALYAVFTDRMKRPPDWLKGLLFSLLPLAISLFIVLPGLGLGAFNTEAGHVTGLGEAVRHICYGVLLGLLTPVFLPRLPGPKAQGTLSEPSPLLSPATPVPVREEGTSRPRTGYR